MSHFRARGLRLKSPPGMRSEATPQSEIPTEFDLQRDAERARWMRRRFLWFCAINLALALLQLPSLRDSLRGILVGGPMNAPRELAMFHIAIFVPTVVVYVVVFLHVLRRPPPLRKIVLLALWLTIVLNSISLISTRISLELMGSMVRAQMVRSFDQTIRDRNRGRPPARIELSPEARDDALRPA